MLEIIKSSGGFIIGVLVTCVFGLASFWLQRRWLARGEFYTVVAEQLAKLDVTNFQANPGTPGRNAAAEDVFLKECLPVILAASRKVRPHITAYESKRLDKILSELKSYHAKANGLTSRCLDQNVGQPAFSIIVNDLLGQLHDSIPQKLLP